MEAGNLSCQCSWGAIYQAALWRYLGGHECLHQSADWNNSGGFLSISGKAGNRKQMASFSWRGGCIIPLLGTFMLLYVALTKGKKIYLVFAGIILGATVAVRMPNITYMALIIPVWYYSRQNCKEESQEEKWFQKLLGQTGYCILGYCLGLVVPIGFICIRYGMEAYPKMITSLFGMTDTATDYKPTSMISAMFEDYAAYSFWLILFVVYMIAGLVLVHLLKGRFEKAKKILFVAGMFVLLRLCYGRGMFDFNFTAYFCMY